MGYNPKQVLALFRNPAYLGMHLVLEKHGEQFVRDSITETFARWGRPVTWPEPGSAEIPTALSPAEDPPRDAVTTNAEPAQRSLETAIDPLGARIPKVNL